MSELKVNKVTPRSGTTVTLGDSGDSVAIPSGVGFNGFNHRNIIINGDMSIAQRSTSVASITATGYYTVDRWQTVISSLGTWTQSQSTDVPTGQGFAKSLKMDCTTADATPSASDSLYVRTKFEGQNLQYLKKGTASAVSLTASFWVKSNKTGTYIVELLDNDNSDFVSQSYTINVANTWEKKTVTFPADTTSAFDNDNAVSLGIHFYLGAGTDITSGTLNSTWTDSAIQTGRAVGQVNLADDTANEWYITGVQLEAGTTASDFEFLPVDVNLARCLRYYQLIATGVSSLIGNAYAYNSTEAASQIRVLSMRATPSVDQTSGASFYRFTANATNNAFDSFTFDGGSNKVVNIKTTSISGLTGANAGAFSGTNASSYLALSAEL